MVAETQEGVERYYYELRKKLSDFDAVLAFQRDQTYAEYLPPPPLPAPAPTTTPPRLCARGRMGYCGG